MNTSTRGPQQGGGQPFVMHLERVCRLIEMGQTFSVEFNPCGDVAIDRVVRDVGLRIRDGGEVAMKTLNGAEVLAFGLTLANYKRLWRCWQNGTPTEGQRKAVAWG